MYAEPVLTRYLELGQIQSLVGECSERLKPIVLTALLTGLRKSDILNLRWDDINFENRLIHLNQAKTKNPIVIHLSESMVTVLEGISRHPDSPLVFQQQGEVASRFGWVRGEFERAVKAARLPEDVVFYSLRHTFGTQQRFLGKDITVIKERN